MTANILRIDTETGAAIRQARESRNMTQAALASLAGTSQQTVDRIERGVVRASRAVAAIHDILGTDLPHGPADGLSAPAPRSSNLTQLRESLDEVIDLLHALDKVGDGIGGADGYSVSAVALAAKSVADNALDAVKAMERAR
ncbi:hypothetical protein ASE04_09765 [Rhizobium sp. Root708]|uniref:helix-turn-helix domain-containing protein n=1 Tax=Rhizobium sp. Root708 TaxID=1736592 RepID=UPI00070156B1|nr:helix-turn-helix transcriptional regulator [Rhizobium sp. Root708]KRB51807.1 hypothetical protein ASE04_09765 [Rhizobium sp. Root708]